METIGYKFENVYYDASHNPVGRPADGVSRYASFVTDIPDPVPSQLILKLHNSWFGPEWGLLYRDPSTGHVFGYSDWAPIILEPDLDTWWNGQPEYGDGPWNGHQGASLVRINISIYRSNFSTPADCTVHSLVCIPGMVPMPWSGNPIGTPPVDVPYTSGEWNFAVTSAWDGSDILIPLSPDAKVIQGEVEFDEIPGDQTLVTDPEYGNPIFQDVTDPALPELLTGEGGIWTPDWPYQEPVATAGLALASATRLN